jgi:hypothetical protein
LLATSGLYNAQRGGTASTIGQYWLDEPLAGIRRDMASRNRQQCRPIPDRWLKIDAPFWKSEHTPNSERLVERCAADDKAPERGELRSIEAYFVSGTNTPRHSGGGGFASK